MRATRTNYYQMTQTHFNKDEYIILFDTGSGYYYAFEDSADFLAENFRQLREYRYRNFHLKSGMRIYEYQLPEEINLENCERIENCYGLLKRELLQDDSIVEETNVIFDDDDTEENEEKNCDNLNEILELFVFDEDSITIEYERRINNIEITKTCFNCRYHDTEKCGSPIELTVCEMWAYRTETNRDAYDARNERRNRNRNTNPDEWHTNYYRPT